MIRYQISNASFKSPSLTEAVQKIDMFLKEGYEYHDIIYSIKVLNLSKDIITTRLSALAAVNHKAPLLKVFLLSDKKFVNYLNSVGKLIK